MAHSSITAIASRLTQLDKAIESGHLDGDGAALLTERYAWALDGGHLGISRLKSAEPANADDDEAAIPFTISTQEEDRDGDIVISKGCLVDQYKFNPVVFFGHQEWAVPIAAARSPRGQLAIWPEENRIRSVAYFDKDDSDAMFIYGKIKRGFLSASSIAFVPIKAHRREYEEKANSQHSPLMPPGWVFELYTLTEWSIVGVPANAGAIRDSLDSERSFISPKLFKAMKPFAEKSRGRCFSGYCPPMPVKPVKSVEQPMRVPAKPKAVVPTVDTIKRWNKSLSEAFEVGEQVLPASSTAYDWAAKYLQCEIKHIHQTSTTIPAPRMGSFLTGLKHALAQFHLNDTRRIDGSYQNGRESPPTYEVVQLNSKQRDTFLVNGTQFWQEHSQRKGQKLHSVLKTVTSLREGRKFILDFNPGWGGLNLTIYTKDQHAEFGQQLMDHSWAWAKANNFLKGEAFALSGEFLPRTDESWNDVFLEAKNEKVLKRVLTLFNDKQMGFANRGIVMCGPPGTGKTLSGRVLRNQAKGTYIWVSSRDFHKAGSFGGIRLAFEMARELAPSIVFIEDVDNWMSDTTVDLLKTEMDGISRSKGVLTILTTNFPEQMPEALIDRPGRFHDVLSFGLPTPSARKQMLGKWLPTEAKEMLDEAVTRTNGYSGAHVYELAQFVRALNEHDGIECNEAVREALRKIDEQRELITQLQLTGSNYRYRKEPSNMAPKKTKGKAVAVAKGKTAPVAKGKCGCKSKGVKKGSTQADMEAPNNHPPAQETTKEPIQDCVTAKVPKLIEEGYEPNQAAAVAMSMCNEGKSLGEDITGHEQHAQQIKDMLSGASGAAGGYTEPETKAEDADAEEEDEELLEDADVDAEPEATDPDGEEEKDETEEPVRASHGATTLAKLLAHMEEAKSYIENELPVMDHAELKDYLGGECSDTLKSMTEKMNELAGEHFPEHDMKELAAAPTDQGNPADSNLEGEVGLVQPKDEETAAPVDTPIESTEEILDRYRNPGAKGKKRKKDVQPPSPMPEDMRPEVERELPTDDLHEKAAMCMKDASEYMTDLAQSDEIPKRHKSGLSYHADSLNSMHKELSTATGQEHAAPGPEATATGGEQGMVPGGSKDATSLGHRFKALLNNMEKVANTRIN